MLRSKVSAEQCATLDSPAIEDSAGRVRLQDATDGLKRRHPELSASGKLSPGQVVLLLAIIVALPASVTFGGNGCLADIALAGLMLPFACVVLVRALVAWHAFQPSNVASVSPPRLAASELPRYTVLVALYREVAVAHQLVASLRKLDYPTANLEVLLVTEADDVETRAALRICAPPPHMRIVTVPDGQPRTKPRALNYALAEATGEFVVVYDAEDEPEADQLRKAAAVFRHARHSVGCLQAQLKIHGADTNWFTAQFAIEYAALFGFILPALERWRLPIPLGGTSNHFRRSALDHVGGWDAYNVTEDADLGIRLARFGWHVRVLNSVTWEEAPDTFGAWRKQRVRWLKGWLQTALVHTRQPLRLLRELGPRAFFGIHVTFASMLLSAIVHPAYLLALSVAMAGNELIGSSWLWWVGTIVFAAGYIASTAIAWHAAMSNGYSGIAARTIWLPVYWLMISIAAYGALHEFALRQSRYRWNKTEHRGRHASTARSGPPTQKIADQAQA